MNRPSRCARVVSLVAAVLLAAAASAQDRPAEEILAELHAAVLPAYNVNLDAPNTNYREEFFRQRREVLLRRADLIGELHRAHPDHPAAADFLPERWETLFQWKDAWTEVFDETQARPRRRARASHRALRAVLAGLERHAPLQHAA